MIEALVAAYQDTYSNVHRGLHFLSEASTDAYEAVRGKVAHFVGAKSGDEIVLTAGATMALNMIAQCWALPRLKAGDEILISIGGSVAHAPTAVEGTADSTHWRHRRHHIGWGLLKTPAIIYSYRQLVLVY